MRKRTCRERDSTAASRTPRLETGVISVFGSMDGSIFLIMWHFQHRRSKRKW
jgi:hypothetical protein